MIGSINSSSNYYQSKIINQTFDNMYQKNSTINNAMQNTYNTSREIVGGVVNAATNTGSLINQTNQINNTQTQNNQQSQNPIGNIVNLVI